MRCETPDSNRPMVVRETPHRRASSKRDKPARSRSASRRNSNVGSGMAASYVPLPDLATGTRTYPPTQTSHPIVLRVESHTLYPAPAKPGDFVVVWPDRVEIVRPAGNNCDGWLRQWSQGHLTPVSADDAERLFHLVHST